MGFRRVIVPVDFSECSLRAARYAVEAAPDGEIELLHVIVPQPPAVFPDQVTVDGMPPFHDAEVERDHHGHELIARIAETLGHPRMRSEIVTGDPATEILAARKRADADLIVMGTHGHGGLRRLVLGSVTDAVLRQATCPVLTIRDCAETAQHFAPAP